jgi:hypothetical protein
LRYEASKPCLFLEIILWLFPS